MLHCRAFTPAPVRPLGPGRPGCSCFTDEGTEALEKVCPKLHESNWRSRGLSISSAPLLLLIPAFFPKGMAHDLTFINRSLWLLGEEYME